MIRNQGHQVSAPLIIDDKEDSGQALATWILQSLRAHDSDPTVELYMVPVLYLSHWSPIALQVSSNATVMTTTQDISAAILHS